MGQQGRTNPEDGWPAPLKRSTPEGDASAAFGGLARLLDSFESGTNASFNMVRRIILLRKKREQTIDDMLSMVAAGRLIFIDEAARHEFLDLTKTTLGQLREEVHILSDFTDCIREVTERALAGKGGKGTG